MQPSRDLSRLIEIMAALRNKDTGCPWDIEQDFKSISRYTIEEAYEVADAIEREDFDDLREELGDLLLQPVYHAQMAAEKNLFDFGDVVQAITEKLIRRHPHVFGPEAAEGAAMAKGQWEEAKAAERAAKAAKKGEQAPSSVLDDVPFVLPALNRAEKLSKRAARVGFDWENTEDVFAKCAEELDEVREVVSDGTDQAKIHEEIGDLLFAVSNLARHVGVDPETALNEANLKFTRRFRYVEERCRTENTPIDQAGLAKLDAFWNEIRARDKTGTV